MKKEEKEGFHFVYITEDDIKRETEKQISELIDDKKTDFIFNEQPFYELGGGHDFCYGFFTEYLTKNGIRGRHYASGKWNINNDWYNFINHDFVIIEQTTTNITPTDFNNMAFSVIKNVNAKLLTDYLVEIKPKERP